MKKLGIVYEEMGNLEAIIRRERAEPLVSAIWTSADEIRSRELEKTLALMGSINEEQRRIVEKLSQVLLTRILHHPIQAIRNAAVKDDFETIQTAEILFKIQKKWRNMD